jgi:hypothetical protein
MSALKTQVGGGHYTSMKIQPAEYCHANHIEKLEGDVIAYVSRWRNKNGIEDLKKARHTLDLLIEMEERSKPEKDLLYKCYECDRIFTKDKGDPSMALCNKCKDKESAAEIAHRLGLD